MPRFARFLAPILSVALVAATAASAQQPGQPPSAEAIAEMREAQARFNAMPDSVGTGPFPAIKEVARGLPGHTLYRPANLAARAPGSLGVIGWGNGGCSPDGASQRHHLAELASHGYVVVAPGPILSGPGIPTPDGPPGAGGRSTAADVMAGIEWVLAENAREGSWLFGLVDPAKVALSGYSCGGMQVLSLASDPRVAAIVVHNSGLFPPGAPIRAETPNDKGWLAKLHTPVLYVQGGQSDIAYANGMDDYQRIPGPAAMLNQDVGHGGSFMEPNGGAAAQAAVKWLQWQLRGDAEAGKMFVGPSCGYCNDDHWDYQSKKLD